MKIKNGFVSNSSSSSFILFSHRNVDRAYLEDRIVDDLVSPWDWEDETWDKEYVISNMLEELTPVTMETTLEYGGGYDNRSIIDLLAQYIEQCVIYENNCSYSLVRDNSSAKIAKGVPAQIVELIGKVDDHNISWEERNKIRNEKLIPKLIKYTEKLAADIMKTCPYVYTCSFSDETSYGSTMEHGDTLEKTFNKAFKISNH